MTAVAVSPAERAEAAGLGVVRYGLALVIGWIGLFKFTAVEAAGIKPLVENSPLMGWMYAVLSEQGVSNLIGGVEVLIALMIVSRRWTPRLSAIGSVAAVPMFLVTLSFLVTTPGAWDRVGWFAIPSQFLLKDIVFLGAALLTAGEAWRASGARTDP